MPFLNPSFTKSHKKVNPKANACVSLGYSTGNKGSQVYDYNLGEFHFTRDVVFHEKIIFHRLQVSNLLFLILIWCILSFSSHNWCILSSFIGYDSY